ncbi:MAG: hypothetical protein D6737_00985 [Chloroflexi bacterium]|nr:MAG: hypothetical protein CUN54_00770 [Phototrophicales bacterium]RMF82708.1 MAG: hypothetical protein D6737_00985 [Chloroflexota bacterium]
MNKSGTLMFIVLTALVPIIGGLFLFGSNDPQPTIVNDVVSVDLGEEQAISNEVMQSVLSRPDDAALEPIENSRIDIMQDGSPVPIRNGQTVQITDNLQANLQISPYPPTDFEADIDIYLTTEDGTPVNDAEFDLDYDMLFMRHGESEAVFENLGDGHYQTSVDFLMYGSWAMDTNITLPGQDEPIPMPFVIKVWPS